VVYYTRSAGPRFVDLVAVPIPRKIQEHGTTCDITTGQSSRVVYHGKITTMSKDITGTYADTFKSWDSKRLGAKPSVNDLDTIHKLGARAGKQALANAMALRPQGVTGSEIVIACGAPQLNKMRGFITDGLLKREALPPRNGHTVYKTTLTAKGAARIKGAAKAATPAPAKAKKKAKAKVKPVEPVVVQDAPIQATVPSGT
jgi:hypothetical protein